MSVLGERFAPYTGDTAAFVPYLTMGDPSLDRSIELVKALSRAGSDVIELGIPFSDPLADGSTIQAAMQRALGPEWDRVPLSDVIEGVGRVRGEIDSALIVFSYYNPVFRMGVEKFAAAAADAGIDGVLVPDLTPEEGGPLTKACRAKGLDVVFLIAPTSTDERMKMIGEASGGFVYVVSLTGVTGVRAEIPTDLRELMARVRRNTDMPLAIGFGISTPEMAAEIAKIADGVVVGSALVRIVAEHGDSGGLVELYEGFARSLVEAAHGGSGG